MSGPQKEPKEGQENHQAPFQTQAPTIQLPKGGGAIRGMGEKFAANPVTGTGSMTIPIAVSSGRAGFGPQLSLSYDSGAGNGPFGFGWSLSLPAITRKTDKGLPQYRDADESDVFILSGAEDLVPVLDSDGRRHEDATTAPGFTIHRYRPRIEGLFARIERWTAEDGNVHWRSISRDNILTIYGRDPESRIFDPENPRRIFNWLICETRDDKGNAILYEYKPEDGSGIDLTIAHESHRGGRNDRRRSANRYLKRIKYGNRQPLLYDTGKRPTHLSQAQRDNAGWMFEAVLDYGEHDQDVPTPTGTGEWPVRSDPFSTYRAGFEVRTCRLCQRVLMFHHIPDTPEGTKGYDGLVRSTDFAYAFEQDPAGTPNPIYTFLARVTQTGHKPGEDGQGYISRSLPPVEFEYSRPEVQETVEAVDAASLENLPLGLDGTAFQWTDLHGEGIPGILTEQADAWYYKRNHSPIDGDQKAAFAPLERVARKPNAAIAAGAQIMDLAGDGQPDLVVLDDPVPGFYEHDGDQDWLPFRPFVSRLNRSSRDPNLKFVDLDGDGHADVLITEDDALVWHASLGEAGFAPARRTAQVLDEEKGPRLVFADASQSVYLADLSGDGLTDLVRIRNGEVCYWPNLGYCRFGAKVTMDDAPWFDRPDQFDQKRIRLADIDGSGTTDILYLHRDGVRLYFNQSGNGWSAAQALPVFPQADNIAAVTAVDLLGNGTACLVWSSPLPGNAGQQMRYVNLMGGRKPHLLIGTVNNLGAETRIDYAPSTKFYLQDKRDGRPWITRLPFPVHVVERVETYDHISRNRFVARYAYHHGYFDGEEREFRGFGKVEQWDTEEYAMLTANGTLTPDEEEGASNEEMASHMPPVHTVTWFHTGARLGGAEMSLLFAQEYYGAPSPSDPGFENNFSDFINRQLLPDTILEPGLPVEEAREACRSLKGAMLHQEVYAEDGTDEAQYPYTVTEQNFTIRRLQPHGENRHAVFFTHAREAISYHYERNPDDPRTTHAMTLEVDEFGNVLKEVAIGYGRRPGQSPLQSADKEKQEQILVTYTENDVTGAVDKAVTDPEYDPDNYRTPLPCETRTFELNGLTPENGAGRFSFDELTKENYEKIRTLLSVPYETPVDYAAKQKRLIERLRTYFRPDDLGASHNNPLALLSLKALQPLALPGETYKLAFTPELLTQVYQRNGVPLLSDPTNVLGGQETDGGSYVDLDNDGHWWIPSGRVFYSSGSDDTAAQELTYARQHFFVPHRYRDPFGHFSTITNDDYDLLITETADAVGNRVAAENDYRVLQPKLMTGPNGNRSAVAFDTLGLVAGTAAMGKAGEMLGDALPADFEADLTQARIDRFHEADDPHVPAPDLLKNATTRIIYDLDRFRRSQQDHPQEPEKWLPVYAATLTRETHLSDPLPTGGLKIQLGFSYSDGFGREIQKKIQAEPGPLDLNDLNSPTVDPRWVGSGWTIFNNKGKPVRQYEPFFDDTHHFRFGKAVGVSPILFYDPVGRVIATLHPNHTYEKVVFDPWQQTIYDVNDTVTFDPKTDVDVGAFLTRLPDDEYLPTWHQQRIGGALGTPEQVAAQKAAAHADTPTTAHFNSLGRPFFTIARNRVVCQNHADNGTESELSTRVELDIEGNQRSVTDAKGRVVMRYAYDMLGTVIHQASMEAGARWMLNDVTGKPIRTWDSRGFSHRMTYDALRRPLNHYVSDSGQAQQLVEKTIYGDTPWDGTAETLEHPERTNHRGKPFKVYDNAGVVTSEAYDFKGNLLRGSRQLRQDYKNTADWKQNPELEPEIFRSRTWYDALNRPVQLLSPHSDQPGTRFDIIRPGYNEANLLERVAVWPQQQDEPGGLLDPGTAGLHAVTNIDYDAKGQRQRIEYGNGAMTRYSYDPDTYRLIRLLTSRPTGGNGLAAGIFSNPNTLQDLRYTYDPAGNITRIEDNALQTTFHGGVVDPVSRYTYDALYRLIEAEGREHIGQCGIPVEKTNTRDYPFAGFGPQTGDPRALRNYTERFVYDEVGNFLNFIHRAEGGSWQRDYEYEEVSQLAGPGEEVYSNRLTRTVLHPNGSQPVVEPYSYDAHGNMISMPHLTVMEWDFRDQLCASSRQVVNNGGTPEITWYVYDGSGQRVRKVTENDAAAGSNPMRKNERIYLGGFEVYREWNGGDCSLERLSLHVMDDKQRIALVETKMVDAGSNEGLGVPLVRYQLANHLGSASLELDGKGVLISYEEYHPYGTTAFQLHKGEVSRKRYRYTGMERDEETGFNYHSARYYALWLGRWCSCDPQRLIDGLNLFLYSRNSPTNIVDQDGTDSSFWNNLKNATRATLNSVKKIGKKIWQGIKKGMTATKEAIDTVTKWIRTKVTTIFKWIKIAATTFWDRLKKTANATWGWITKTFSAPPDDVLTGRIRGNSMPRQETEKAPEPKNKQRNKNEERKNNSDVLNRYTPPILRTTRKYFQQENSERLKGKPIEGRNIPTPPASQPPGDLPTSLKLFSIGRIEFRLNSDSLPEYTTPSLRPESNQHLRLDEPLTSSQATPSLFDIVGEHPAEFKDAVWDLLKRTCPQFAEFITGLAPSDSSPKNKSSISIDIVPGKNFKGGGALITIDPGF